MAMADAIKRLIYQFTSTGADQVAGDMNKVAEAQTTTQKSALDLDRQFQSLERRFNDAARAQQDFAKVQSQVNAAVAQNPALMERGNVVLAAAADRYGQVTGAQRAFATSMSGMQSQMVAMAGGLGLVGAALSAFGPAGLAAAVGLKLVSDAITLVRETAKNAGEGSAALVSLSEATRLSIDEIRSLKKTAAEFGVGGDQIERWLQRAAIGMEEAKTGSGQLADALQAIDPSFLKALQDSKSMAEGLDVMAKAATSAKEQGKDVALFYRDLFGRGSGRADPVFSAVVDKGGLEQSAAAMKSYGGAVENTIREQARLSREIEDQNKKSEILNQTILHSKTVLELELSAIKATNAAKEELIKIQEGTLGAYTRSEATHQAAIKLYGDEITALENLSAAEEARAAAAQRLGRRGSAAGAAISSPSLERDMALQEGPTPPSAITGSIEAETKARKDNLLVLEQTLAADTKWISALGAGATEAEKATLALDKLNVEMAKNSLGAKDSAQAQALYQRALEAIERQANSLDTAFRNNIQTIRARTAAEREAAAASEAAAGASGGAPERELAAARAVTIEREKQAAGHRDVMDAAAEELAITNAVTAQTRLQAQAQQRFNQAIREGRTEEQALEEAQALVTQEIAKQEKLHREAMIAGQERLTVAQAVGGAEKMAAEEVVKFNELLREGRTIEQALQEAALDRQVKQAQVNSSALEQLAALRDQYNVAIAITDEDKAQAEAQATINKLIREGVDATIALAVGQQQVANAMAAVNARQQQAAQAADKAAEEADLAVAAEHRVAARSDAPLTLETIQMYGAGAAFQAPDLLRDIADQAQRGHQEAVQRAKDLYPSWEDKAKAAEDAAKQAQQDAIQKQQQAQQQAQQDAQQAQQQAAQQQQNIQDQIRSLIEDANLKAAEAQGGDVAAQYKAQLAYAKAIEEGATVEQAAQIGQLTLVAALKDNTSATQANTDALSPYYATDPRLSHIGFRSDSGVLDYDPFKLAASGAPGPAAIPLGSAASPTSALPATYSPPLAPAVPGPATVPDTVTTDQYGMPTNVDWSHPYDPASGFPPHVGDWVPWNNTGKWMPTSGKEGWWEGPGAGQTPGPFVFFGSQQPPDSFLHPPYITLAEGGILGPGGLAYVGEHGPNPGFIRAGSEPIMISPDDPRLDSTRTQRDERPIQIVQNFNAPISRDIIGEMKTTAFQGAQSGIRQALMAGSK